MQDTYAGLRRLVEKAATQAAAIATGFVDEGFAAYEKAPGDFLTEADTAIDTYLRDFLCTAEPTFGWLSEETADSPERLSRDAVWVVDPIDGTKQFVNGTGEWAISIGLAVAGAPVLGAVIAPLAPEGSRLMVGSLFAHGRGNSAGKVWLNGTEVPQPVCVPQPQGEKLECLVSTTDVKKGLWAPYENKLTLKPVGSIAYKLALVGVGLGQSTASLTPKNEWDICAGHAIAAAAGLHMQTLNGQPITYNKPKPRDKGFVCSAKQNANRLKQTIGISERDLCF